MSPRVHYKFRLYIAGNAQNSVLALANLSAICHAHLAGRYTIEVVDVFREPGRALVDGVRMTPSLIRLSPAPVQRIIGTLSQTAHVLMLLGLTAVAA
jgi:circadian clock protein KaiB